MDSIQVTRHRGYKKKPWRVLHRPDGYLYGSDGKHARFDTEAEAEAAALRMRNHYMISDLRDRKSALERSILESEQQLVKIRKEMAELEAADQVSFL
jgi:hypothetical protein